MFYSPIACITAWTTGKPPWESWVLAMVQPRFSGVLYTADPTGDDRDSIRISAVAGWATNWWVVTPPEQTYRLDKKTLAVLENKGSAGAAPPVFLQELGAHAADLEAHYGRPLDVEWALDHSGQLFLLQVRPLLVLVEENKANEQTALSIPAIPCSFTVANVQPGVW